ncbi:ATP-binding cassette domain-containing protein [Amycolatopsis orientalis]|uniref:ATP-binding cassette domain-containing protein n=1 Tax=Amycolatopsis orientalis TaxID=31958 RepID=UPI000416CF9C|nr:ATP-binding cassette domain-containing protein [Amycolatopsis orientalis]
MTASTAEKSRTPGGRRDCPAIETTGLTKSFGAHRALDGLDLTVPPGIVYGVLGPNGAGKTTAVKVLATLLRPGGGTARVFGHDVSAEPDAVRARISLTGQYASVDDVLTGEENLVMLARLLGHGKAAARRRAGRLLSAFGLDEAAGRQVKTYSGGMRRRLDIAASIIRTPDLLVLDEPTTGLDPRSRVQVWDIVRTIVEQGTTVLLTTQYLEEADRLAARIAVIDRGRVVAEGTPGELKASAGAGTVHLRLCDPADRHTAEAVLARVLSARVESDADPLVLSALVAVAGAEKRASTVLAELDDAGVRVDSFTLGRPSLDQVFLALTERTAGQETDG